MIKVTSTSNEKYKYIKSLLNKKNRLLNMEYTVEGIKSVNDAITASKPISQIVVSNSFYIKTEFTYPDATNVIVVDDNIFPQLCDTKTPQGIIAVIKMSDEKAFAPKPDGRYIYCDNVRDPGNIGTIIRTAEAAGFDGVLMSPDCVDIYSPKVVRASMGSYFNIDIISDIDISTLKEFKCNGAKLIAGALSNKSSDYRKADYSLPLIIVVGNEANGVSEEVLSICDYVKIPIYGKAESLNVSIAAAILIYESLHDIEN